MMHRLFTTCSCICTFRAIVCAVKLLEVGSAQWRSSHLSKFRYQWKEKGLPRVVVTQEELRSQLHRNRPPVHLVPIRCRCASFNKLPVHRSLGGNRLIVRAFTAPLAEPTRTVFDPSIGPKYLPCSNRESKGPRRRLDGCNNIHHTRSPNCAKEEEQRAFPHFFRMLSCRLDPPTVHADGIRHKPRQQIMVCWDLHSRRATASLIDLTCPLMTFTELSAAPLDCGSPSAGVSCTTSPVQANCTVMSNARMEGSLLHRFHFSSFRWRQDSAAVIQTSSSCKWVTQSSQSSPPDLFPVQLHEQPPEPLLQSL